jgi:octaprenyl-diphosphate synthase
MSLMKVPCAAGSFQSKPCGRKKVAVLVGDYLLSRGLLMAVDAEAYDLLKITSEAVRQMSEGELLQIEKARRLDITEEVYFDIIQRKTASLIAACCACGAASVSDSPETTANMKRFGQLVGLAFQIKDDLLDLGDGERIGKPTGGDIRERKMTLPLIHTLNKATARERRRLIRLVKYQNHKDYAVQEVMDAIIEGPGMRYARKKMTDLRDEAMTLLDLVPNSEAKSALIGLVDYTIERKR